MFIGGDFAMRGLIKKILQEMLFVLTFLMDVWYNL